MPYPGFFAPLDAQHDADFAYETAQEEIGEQIDTGEHECARCTADEISDICVEEYLNELGVAAAEAYAEDMAEARAYH